MKKLCKQCEKEFNTIPAKIKVGKGKYCSRSCYAKAITMRPEDRKPKCDVYRDYRNRVRFGGNRFKAFERDNHQCQHCGTKDKLQIHHIDGRGYKTVGIKEANNSLENLLTLCPYCHIKVTNKERAKYRSLKI